MNIQEILLYAIVLICIINLLRIATYLITSDLYMISVAKRKDAAKVRSLPTISVIIPAHNEVLTIGKAIAAMRDIYYPSSKLEVIIMDDGSTDGTAQKAQKLIDVSSRGPIFRVISRPNRGKAAALNYAIRYKARGSLIVCLDADSHLDKWALINAVWHFEDKKVMALSMNVNVVEDGTLLGLMQRIEYLVNYHMKKGQDYMGLQYIIGGVGSMFRRSVLSRVKFYDTNTMTEDIDLTLKLLLHKRLGEKLAYAADSVSYTDPAHSIHDLALQRFRWKYGRSQTFIKHATLFFSRNPAHSKRLSWFMLPYVLLQDAMFLVEPVIVGYLLYIVLRFGDLGVLTTAFMLMTLYLGLSIWSSRHLSIKDRLRLTYYAPPMYFLMYVMTYVEYFALIKALLGSRRLRSSMLQHHTTWKSPRRVPITTN